MLAEDVQWALAEDVQLALAEDVTMLVDGARQAGRMAGTGGSRPVARSLSGRRRGKLAAGPGCGPRRVVIPYSLAAQVPWRWSRLACGRTRTLDLTGVPRCP